MKSCKPPRPPGRGGRPALGSVRATTARADVEDYEFQLVDKTVKKGEASHRRPPYPQAGRQTGPGRRHLRKRLDMAPDGMESMKTTIDAMPEHRAGSL